MAIVNRISDFALHNAHNLMCLWREMKSTD